MASTGATAPGAASGTGWTTASNALAADAAYATYSITPAGSSNVLQLTEFGFAIPATATIDGIEGVIKANYSTGDGCQLITIRLLIGGVAAGDTKGPQALTTTNTNYTFGGAADLWGLTPTVAQVNATDFGVQVAGQEIGGENGTIVRIDFVSINVYYTVPALGKFVNTMIARMRRN